jgi:hypothetical protein
VFSTSSDASIHALHCVLQPRYLLLISTSITYSSSTQTFHALIVPFSQGSKRHGTIDSLKGEPTAAGTYTSAIAKGLFTPEEDIKLYIGTSVHIATGEAGTVTAAFGKAGKCRLSFDAIGGTACAVGTAVWMQEQA